MRYRELLLDDAAATKPKQPLAPAQSRREAEKAKVNERVRDAQAACARKVAASRAKE